MQEKRKRSGRREGGKPLKGCVAAYTRAIVHPLIPSPFSEFFSCFPTFPPAKSFAALLLS
jgi:hypothetical protein